MNKQAGLYMTRKTEGDHGQRRRRGLLRRVDSR